MLLLTAVVYTILVHVLVAVHGQQSALAVVLGRDFEGWISLLIYAAAVPTAFIEPRISAGLYGLVAVIWLVPDRRIEKVVEEKPVSGDGIKE